MDGPYLLGIDNGGTVAKAAVFAADGKELAVASRKSGSVSPRPGWVEFDLDGLWSATAGAIREAIGKSGVDSREIAGVACAGHGNGIYLVDAEGNAVRNAIFSADSRARAIVERWVADGVDKAVLPKTMQALWPGQPNALLAWLRENEPDAIRRTRWVLMCKDFIRLRLTGEVHAELTDMSGTSLLDVGTGDYDTEILQSFGIAEMRRMLPPIRQSADVCGRVSAQAAAQTGLAEDTPVAGGLFDIDACALATALTGESQLGMILGTWSINQYVSRTPVADGRVFMTSRYCIPGCYLMLEASPTSAGNLEWFIAQFLRAEVQAAPPGDGDIYESINHWVEQTGPEESAVLFLPFLYGSNVGPDASAALVGLSDRHHRGHVLRAIYEGVAFGHQTHVERLLAVRPMPQVIRAAGGATRSDVWMQMLADVFQVPVEVPEGSELGALGAAICAAVAAGCHPDFPAACSAMVHLARRFEPNPSLADVYRQKYARYKRLLEALAPAWHDLRWPPDDA